MIKVGPKPFSNYETSVWDHQGKTEIAQIFISCSSSYINALHFLYVENDGRHVLSERIGGEDSASMKSISFDYPSEYITRVSGKYYQSEGLVSITFYTNKGTYGPFVPNKPYSKFNYPDDYDEFNYETGGNKFYGFFGTCSKSCIKGIGFYLKPNETVANPLCLPKRSPPSFR